MNPGQGDGIVLLLLREFLFISFSRWCFSLVLPTIKGVAQLALPMKRIASLLDALAV